MSNFMSVAREIVWHVLYVSESREWTLRAGVLFIETVDWVQIAGILWLAIRPGGQTAGVFDVITWHVFIWLHS